MLHKRIVEWIKQYAKDNNRKTLIVGISGGIDSSVVSTLCAMTKMKTIAVSLPLNNTDEQDDLSMDHGDWLANKFRNVKHEVFNLERTYEKFWLELFNEYGDEHAFANSKSRLRRLLSRPTTLPASSRRQTHYWGCCRRMSPSLRRSLGNPKYHLLHG